MLRELHITNLAVIEDATIELREGLNCFTGQTGAGKSLLIGALEALLGLRSGNDLLRDGAQEGRVSGLFELADGPTIRQVNAIADLQLDERGRGEQLLVTRKFFVSGRTSFSVNGNPATASMVRSLGQLLVEVHGQHDHQLLLKPSSQLELLDRFGGCGPLREQFIGLHRQLQGLTHKRAELHASQSLRRQQLELYEFQADEIDQAEPDAAEYEELQARHKLLSNLGKVQRDAGAAYAALYEAEGSILERLHALVGVLRQLSDLDEELGPVAETVKAAVSQLQDAGFDLSRYLNRIDLDPQELGEAADRLNLLNRLVHKYGQGGSMEQVMAYRQQIGLEIERLRHETHDLDRTDQEIEPIRQRLRETGRQLSHGRKAAAARIHPLVEKQLAELGMGGAKFEVSFEALAPDGAESTCGFDAIEMLVQPNPGQAARPLRKIASGGELSRIMLAVKAILAAADRIGLLIFDEVDANIGGRMGHVVGDKLRRVAQGRQVLCITHLPQIAAFADHHLKISKAVSGGLTRTRVEPLTGREPRADELAEMLAGQHRNETTHRQALQMLDDSNPKTRQAA